MLLFWNSCWRPPLGCRCSRPRGCRETPGAAQLPVFVADRRHLASLLGRLGHGLVRPPGRTATGSVGEAWRQRQRHETSRAGTGVWGSARARERLTESCAPSQPQAGAGQDQARGRASIPARPERSARRKGRPVRHRPGEQAQTAGHQGKGEEAPGAPLRAPK